MIRQETVDVLIVGSGPAGMSTALHLLQADQAWASQVVVVEKAVHPREKLCGGGVTQLGERVLTNLGLSFEPTHVPVREMRLICQHRLYAVHDAHAPVFRIVRRDEFDHWLVRCAEQQGLSVRQGEAVTDIIPHEDRVEVQTEQATFQAKLVVAADGSNSTVRHKLKLPMKPGKARTFEVLTAEKEHTAAFDQGIVEYDFSAIFDGLQGYAWNFPCMIGGSPCMSRGIFDSRMRSTRPRINLKHTLQQHLVRAGKRLEDYQLRGFPIQWFDRNSVFAIPRILFAGDAAGVDAIFGEGISFALAYGQAAAQEITQAFASQDFSCSGYKNRILKHPTLRQLRPRTTIAHILYELPRFPWLEKRIWDMTPFFVRMVMRFRPHDFPLAHPRIIRKPASLRIEDEKDLPY